MVSFSKVKRSNGLSSTVQLWHSERVNENIPLRHTVSPKIEEEERADDEHDAAAYGSCFTTLMQILLGWMTSKGGA